MIIQSVSEDAKCIVDVFRFFTDVLNDKSSKTYLIPFILFQVSIHTQVCDRNREHIVTVIYSYPT